MIAKIVGIFTVNFENHPKRWYENDGISDQPIIMPSLSQFIYFLLGFLFVLATQSSQASDSTGSTGSITITRHANNAAKAFAAHDYAKAKEEYRKAIGLSPDTLEFYYGLYDVCVHSGEWDQVVFALEKIFEIDPTKQQALRAQYGEALYHLGHYDDAVPILKQALKEADLPAPKISLVVPAPIPDSQLEKNAASGSLTPPAPVPVTPEQEVPPPPPSLSAKQVSEFRLNFENAAHSECILTATYEGYEKRDDIVYTNPPIAKYHITKILKGPPLNRDLPLRYEFTDRINDTGAPAGWKFGPDKMPKKGSEWLIFIKNAVPRDEAFDTYQGSYGRQPATDENMNKVYALLENSANR